MICGVLLLCAGAAGHRAHKTAGVCQGLSSRDCFHFARGIGTARFCWALEEMTERARSRPLACSDAASSFFFMVTLSLTQQRVWLRSTQFDLLLPVPLPILPNATNK